MNTPDDWAFFRAHPGRTYRCRLARAAELTRLDAQGALGDVLSTERFVYAIVRYDRGNVQMQIILAAFEQLSEAGACLDEDACRDAWQQGDAILGAHVERAMQ